MAVTVVVTLVTGKDQNPIQIPSYDMSPSHPTLFPAQGRKTVSAAVNPKNDCDLSS